MPSHIGRPVDIMVSPTVHQDLQRILDGAGINFTTVIENVQRSIDNEEKNLDPNQFDYNKYNSYEMVREYFSDENIKYV